MMKQSILAITLLALATTANAAPTQAGRDALARKVTTALLVAGIGTKVAEIALGHDLSPHLKHKLTTLLLVLVGGGLLGERFRPGASKIALRGVLGAALIKPMIANAEKMGQLPIIGKFAHSSQSTAHTVRILGFLLWYELAKNGAVWAADKLGLTSPPEPTKSVKKKG